MNTQHTNSTEPHDYNSTQSALKLPEYGRMIQHMVDYALTIENKEERQRYAEAIATIMLGLNPKMKEVPGFKHKVWDHLAYMSDYKLDINYPFEISKKAIRQENGITAALPAEMYYPMEENYIIIHPKPRFEA